MTHHFQRFQVCTVTYQVFYPLPLRKKERKSPMQNREFLTFFLFPLGGGNCIKRMNDGQNREPNRLSPAWGNREKKYSLYPRV